MKYYSKSLEIAFFLLKPMNNPVGTFQLYKKMFNFQASCRDILKQEKKTACFLSYTPLATMAYRLTVLAFLC